MAASRVATFLAAASLTAACLGAATGCTSVHDDVAFNQNVQNNGQATWLEAADNAVPNGLETLLLNLDERIENVVY